MTTKYVTRHRITHRITYESHIFSLQVQSLPRRAHDGEHISARKWLVVSDTRWFLESKTPKALGSAIYGLYGSTFFTMVTLSCAVAGSYGNLFLQCSAICARDATHTSGCSLKNLTNLYFNPISRSLAHLAPRPWDHRLRATYCSR